MELAPRYDGEPILRIECGVGEVLEPVVRQRRRSVEALRSLSEADWSTPSRCDSWTVKDVVGHLSSTNGFWAMSLLGGLANEPTRVLASFDPKETPAQIAAAVADVSVVDTFAGFEESTEGLCSIIETLTVDQLDVVAEAPPGHLAIDAVLHHALWDSWIHERDVLLPLGHDVVVEADEVACSLRYALALSPSFAWAQNPDATGAVVAVASDPDVTYVARIDGGVTVDDSAPPADALTIRGTAVELTEHLSVRAPYDGVIPDDQAWMLRGLADVFEEPSR